MLARQFSRSVPLIAFSLKYPIVSTFPPLFKFSYAKKEAIPTSKTAQVEKIIEPDLSLPQIYQAIESQNRIDGQMPLIKKWFQVMKKKKPYYDVNAFEYSRKIMKTIGYSKLDEVSFQNLYNVAYIYKYFLREEIAKNDPKIEIAIYQSFLRKIEKAQLSQQNWKLVSKCYQICSQLPIMNPNIHTKIPLLIIKALKQQKRNFDSQALLNILNGLASRETHFKDERTAMVLIIAYFDKKYKDLDNQYKIRIVRELVDFKIQSRFGFSILAQQKILSNFLEDLRANKFNSCSQHLINLLGKNTKSKSMQQITKIVVNDSFELLNGKGELKQALTPILFVRLVTNLSTTNKFSQLTDVQRAKLMEFFRKNISENKEDQIQNQLGIMIGNSYFDNHHHIIKLLIDNSKLNNMTPRLFFQVSRIGLPIKKENIYLDSEVRKNRLEVQQKMEKNDLIIFAALGLQSQINPSNDYFKKYYDKYCDYFKNATLKNGQKLLFELTRIPQTSLYHINRMANLRSVFAVFESKQPHDRYFIRNALLYLTIKYDGIQKALSSVWFKQSQRFELVMQVLQQQLKSQQATLHLSPNILSFINQQIEGYLLKNELSIYYCTISIKHVFTYLTTITRMLQQHLQNTYPDAIYYKYWQIVFTFLKHNDKIYKQFQVQFKYRQFIDIILNVQGHLTKTPQYHKFIDQLLKIIPTLKPHYQTMARIIAKGISLGIVNDHNYAQFTSYINVDYDLQGESKEIIQFWNKSQQKMYPSQFVYPFIKVIGSTRVFAMEELKQQVLKYDEHSLAKALELYNLPLHSQSSKIYLVLLQQFKNKGLKNSGDLNFMLILKNINKYFSNGQFTKEFNRGGMIFQAINAICAVHCTSFHKYTLEYHAQLFDLTNKLKVSSRSYERMILATLLDNSNNNVPMLIKTITTLAHNEFRFNLKELKMIGQAMLSTKADWKQTYSLLREKLQGVLEGRLKKQFEG